jgi:hypothetical protein
LQDSLHAQTLPAASAERDEILIERTIVFSVFEPAFGEEHIWFGEDGGVHEDEVVCFADGRLEGVSVEDLGSRGKRGLTPKGISHSLYLRTSSVATRGSRVVTPIETRRPSEITAD